MKKRWLTVVMLLGVLGLAGPSMADRGQKKEKGNPHQNRAAGDRGRRDNDDARWERRDKFEYRTYGPGEGRPPGWNRGAKTGWGNCGLPPGQAKKYGCRTYIYEGRRYYYYQDDAGRIVVRRPVLQVRVNVH